MSGLQECNSTVEPEDRCASCVPHPRLHNVCAILRPQTRRLRPCVRVRLRPRRLAHPTSTLHATVSARRHAVLRSIQHRSITERSFSHLRDQAGCATDLQRAPCPDSMRLADQITDCEQHGGLKLSRTRPFDPVRYNLSMVAGLRTRSL